MAVLFVHENVWILFTKLGRDKDEKELQREVFRIFIFNYFIAFFDLHNNHEFSVHGRFWEFFGYNGLRLEFRMDDWIVFYSHNAELSKDQVQIDVQSCQNYK